MNILVNRLEHEEIAKSAVDAGRVAGQFTQGAKRGIKLAGRGHTPLGQIGSGVAGRPTYSIRPGMPAAGRAGVHAGVAAGNAPTLAAGAAVGGYAQHKINKSAFGVELGKAMPWRGARKLARKAPEAVKMEFKKPKPGVVPSGPGSKRGSMSQSAWETRMAARRD